MRDLAQGIFPAILTEAGLSQPPAPSSTGAALPVEYACIVSNDSAEVAVMATLTIRDFDDELKAGLRVRAAKHGRSMEAEVRAILRSALIKPSSELGVARRIRQRFADVDEAALLLPTRDESPRAAEFPE